jgi:hypothetical protein
MGASCGYSCLIREGLAHMECMVDGSSWSPLLDGRVLPFVQCGREYHVGCLKEHNMADLTVIFLAWDAERPTQWYAETI